MRRLSIPLVALLCATAVACGGRAPEVFERAADGSIARSGAIGLPPPIPAAPAYVARLRKPAVDRQLHALTKTPGIAVVAPVASKIISVAAAGVPWNMRVAAVEPLGFRSVAPAATRDAEFVWSALMAGEAVVTFQAAEMLGIKDGGRITLGDSNPVRVAALADNGTPNIADIIVAPHIGEAIGLGSPRVVVFGAASGTTVESLAKDIRKRLPGVRLQRVSAPDAPGRQPSQAPQSVTSAPQTGLLGTMNYEILANGFIRPDPAWVASNIATATVPILGEVRCHRYLLPQLAAALAEIEQRGLAGRIYQYGGCYVPRFIDRDPSRSLSMHAFGLAVDLNVPTNQLNTAGNMDPEVVAIFTKWGFEWGGYWSRPDPMHFELARLIET
ncbi:MAG TPA: M15 family metallopeptidase [Actinomycetota bacterium]|nr:M15 family metallopeptidase [Actinomycetota bacterium]